MLLGAASAVRPKRASGGTAFVSLHRQGLKQGNHAGAPQASPQACPHWESTGAAGGTGFGHAGEASSSVPGVLHRTRREHRRPDYINPWSCAHFDNNRISTHPGYGGSSADHECNRRHARDPADNPHANRYA
ncbi:hypothetical protein D1007_44387 [Hordeum vulgare]|nr:hypothetical protein D1007_44387 [Hordeum vulgare]